MSPEARRTEIELTRKYKEEKEAHKRNKEISLLLHYKENK